MGLEARIWALRLGFGPQGWDLGLETVIWAARLEFGPRDWDLRGRDGGGGQGENPQNNERKDDLDWMIDFTYPNFI